MTYEFCEFCDGIFWAKRTTAKYCCAKCRVSANRGQEKPEKPDNRSKYERIAEIVADKSPKAYNSLTRLRDEKGMRALELALEAIEAILKAQSK